MRLANPFLYIVGSLGVDVHEERSEVFDDSILGVEVPLRLLGHAHKGVLEVAYTPIFANPLAFADLHGDAFLVDEFVDTLVHVNTAEAWNVVHVVEVLVVEVLGVSDDQAGLKDQLDGLRAVGALDEAIGAHVEHLLHVVLLQHVSFLVRQVYH